MKSDKKIEFRVMIMFPKTVTEVINSYNLKYNTDFEVLEFIDGDVTFCRIAVSRYQTSDIFDLGYALAAYQFSLKEKGEISW